MHRALFFVIVGLGGAAILIALGTWQVQRLVWKQGVIAKIEARMGADPVALPALPDPDTDSYLPVTVTGRFTGDTLRVLVSKKAVGAGYRLVTALDTGERNLLVDRGFVPTTQANLQPQDQQVTVIGNLQWPNETDSFTPAPDVSGNEWFARDVPKMAAQLGTGPLLVVARTLSPAERDVAPMPVDTARIPNNHLQYAITWFSLAAIWLAMSVYFLRTQAQKPES